MLGGKQLLILCWALNSLFPGWSDPTPIASNTTCSWNEISWRNQTPWPLHSGEAKFACTIAEMTQVGPVNVQHHEKKMMMNSPCVFLACPIPYMFSLEVQICWSDYNHSFRFPSTYYWNNKQISCLRTDYTLGHCAPSYWPFHRSKVWQGAWVVQAVKCSTLDLGSGHDVTFHEMEPCVRLYADRSSLGILSLALKISK